jgi:hypothetical protein
VLLALVLGACGSDGDSSDVATLDESAAAEDDSDGGGGGADGDLSEEEAEEAMLEFAQCMREHGIDMPDPDTSGGGAVFVGPGSEDGEAPDMEEFEAADEACRPLIEGVLGPPEEMTPEEQAEMQDQMLAMAQCMRDHGIDMPDPEFGEGGMVEQRLGSEDGEGPDIDPMSEEFQEAQEECAEEAGMDGAVFGTGPGGPPPDGEGPDGGERPRLESSGAADSGASTNGDDEDDQ